MGRLPGLLQELLGILRRGDHDVSWTGYATVDELIAELEALSEPVRRGDPAACARLRHLCVPTGAIHEVAVSTGRSAAWLELANDKYSAPPAAGRAP
ncbi:hypothetical protein [Amycolatopsis deserti]|uniref:hypothetical protein n=1 Tax=Amycolatopsis deserti TaxID=185696 RepID=UPI00174A0CDD|nr:hypothetical protein [Amycolatopsis deserti]